MFRFVALCFAMLVRLFYSWQNLFLENLALRQQLVALKRRHPYPNLELEKGTFDGRIRSVTSGRVVPQERLGGLHDRYDRAA
jgi:hypothetical protein